MHAAMDFALKEPGGFKHAEVLGDGGERDAERFGQFGDHGFAAREAREDGAAGGIGEGREGGVEHGAGIVNHMV